MLAPLGCSCLLDPLLTLFMCIRHSHSCLRHPLPISFHSLISVLHLHMLSQLRMMHVTSFLHRLIAYRCVVLVIQSVYRVHVFDGSQSGWYTRRATIGAIYAASGTSYICSLLTFLILSSPCILEMTTPIQNCIS